MTATISEWVVFTIFCFGLGALLRTGFRLALEWRRSRRSRLALAEADFGSPGESRAFEQLYAQCARYFEQTNSLDPGVIADAIERELPLLREAAARYRESVIRAHQERNRPCLSSSRTPLIR